MSTPASSRVAWDTLDCRPDDGLGARATIGLIALSIDGIIESELRRFLDVDGVELFTTRLAPSSDTSPDGLRQLRADIPRTAATLLPGRKLDVIAFGCTSGAMAIGPGSVAARIGDIRPGTPVVDPISASLAALAHVGVKRAGVLTPYVDSVNAVVADYLSASGLVIGAAGSFKQLPPVINRISEADVRDAAITLGQRDVDGVFISCTGLRCAGVIAEIEDAIGKPVIASNQALAWDILRAAHLPTRLPGFGRLFADA